MAKPSHIQSCRNGKRFKHDTNYYFTFPSISTPTPTPTAAATATANTTTRTKTTISLAFSPPSTLYKTGCWSLLSLALQLSLELILLLLLLSPSYTSISTTIHNMQCTISSELYNKRQRERKCSLNLKCSFMLLFFLSV